MKRVLITGNTSGLGKELESYYRTLGFEVTTISRSPSENSTDHYLIDLKLTSLLASKMKQIAKDKKFDYVFINAGKLGTLSRSEELPQEHLVNAFEINVLSTKVIVDELLRLGACKKFINISSGASFKPYYGWSLYCISKAAIRQMFRCYQEENRDLNFLSLNPGPMRTKMQDEILSYDQDKISSVKKFAKIQDKIPSPEQRAREIVEKIDFYLNNSVSGYHDMREE
jgi:NAD(P)-dependent dehydrogenase (short-subunit alcohol dehydrogenase family)